MLVPRRQATGSLVYASTMQHNICAAVLPGGLLVYWPRPEPKSALRMRQILLLGACPLFQSTTASLWACCTLRDL